MPFHLYLRDRIDVGLLLQGLILSAAPPRAARGEHEDRRQEQAEERQDPNRQTISILGQKHVPSIRGARARCIEGYPLPLRRPCPAHEGVTLLSPIVLVEPA